jgi:hypothetical protein
MNPNKKHPVPCTQATGKTVAPGWSKRAVKPKRASTPKREKKARRESVSK